MRPVSPLSRGLPAAFLLFAAGLLLVPRPAFPHNPVFSPGPHVLFKGGFEARSEYLHERVNSPRATGAGREFTRRLDKLLLGLDYGVTADWQVGADLPLVSRESNRGEERGVGDVALETKYRFLRIDSLGAQTSLTGLFKLKLPTGDAASRPRLGTGSTDVTGGLTAGYEGRRWYAYASSRYRLNTEGEGGLKKGDRQFLDLVGGVRPVLTGYLEPDTVLLLELNWENAGRDRLNGDSLADTSGWELFVSPTVFWTYRNFAIRSGVQIPVAENLRGDQPTSGYRAKLEMQLHY